MFWKTPFIFMLMLILRPSQFPNPSFWDLVIKIKIKETLEYAIANYNDYVRVGNVRGGEGEGDGA